MLAMDDPAHLRMRTLVSKGFTPRRIRELEPQVLELARIHLDSALQTESFDFVAEFAGKLPMDVISELIGVPTPTGPASARWPMRCCTARTAWPMCPAGDGGVDRADEILR